jgi:hypothetical protein
MNKLIPAAVLSLVLGFAVPAAAHPSDGKACPDAAGWWVTDAGRDTYLSRLASRAAEALIPGAKAKDDAMATAPGVYRVSVASGNTPIKSAYLVAVRCEGHAAAFRLKGIVANSRPSIQEDPDTDYR